MITEYSEDIPNIQGLILLDCWEPQVHDHFFKDKFYINLIEKLKDQYFEYIVNSASGLQIDLNDAAMSNTFKVCDYSDNHSIMRNLSEHAGNEKTSTLISKYLFKRPVINIINIHDFAWFSTNYLPPQIKNWLVVGHTWQMCTHSHALGLARLARLTEIYPLNFYATDYSFCTMTEHTATLSDFEQDSLNWRQIQNFGYQLLPQD
jgi:hypothetical protein